MPSYDCVGGDLELTGAVTLGRERGYAGVLQPKFPRVLSVKHQRMLVEMGLTNLLI